MPVNVGGRFRRPLVAALALAVTLGALTAAAGQTDLVDRVGGIVSRAETALRIGDREGALVLLGRLDEILGERTELSDAAEPIVLRALVLWARVLWEDGQRQAADAVLDRIVETDPRYEMPSAAPADLTARYADRRERKVGYLRIGLFPADAEVLVDGELLDPLPELVPVLAGLHEVVARRPGYASDREEVDVRANRTEGVGFTLERSSATLRIATTPPGATVAVDGDVIGRTEAPDEQADTSEPLTIEGLLPGWHDLEVTLADHRPFRQRVEVPRLSDYDLGTLRLERSLGVVLLRDLPADSTVRVDGEEVAPERQVGPDGTPLSSGAARLSLPVGEHRIEVGAPGGVYEASVTVGDGDSVGLDVRARPGIAFLGVRGGEDLDREAVLAQLRPALDGLDAWFVLDRDDALDGTPAPADAAAWADARRRLAQAAPQASLFLQALLPQGSRADHYLVRIWAPAPGPSAPFEIRVPLGDPAGAAPVVEALHPRLPSSSPWLGATIVDSTLSEGAVVVAVQEGGPARQAGLGAGDRIVGLDGAPVAGAAAVWQRVASAAPFSSLALDVVRGDARSAVRVTLGTTPRMPDLGPEVAAPVVWAAAGGALAAAGTAVPAWTLELTRGVVLLHDGDAAGAARLLADVRVTGDSPFGQPAVDYWLGVALALDPSADAADARAALERAAAVPGARLQSNDGPLLAPRAEARLAAIEAGEGS